MIIVVYKKHLKIYGTNIELYFNQVAGTRVCTKLQQSIKRKFSLLIDAIW